MQRVIRFLFWEKFAPNAQAHPDANFTFIFLDMNMFTRTILLKFQHFVIKRVLEIIKNSPLDKHFVVAHN